MSNHDYEQVALIESLGKHLGSGINESEIAVLKRNLLNYTEKELRRVAVRDDYYRRIRIAQLNLNNIEADTLLLELATKEMEWTSSN